MFFPTARARTATVKRLVTSCVLLIRHSTHSRSQTRSLHLNSSLLCSNLLLPFASQRAGLAPLSISPPSRRIDGQSYATDSAAQNTAQGTTGKGASGVEDEVRREREALLAPDHLNEQEKMIFEKLEAALEPMRLEVQDISGGCGSMYGIEIVSEQFRGLSMLKQQRLVNEVLGEEIKGWHGVQLKTRVP